MGFLKYETHSCSWPSYRCYDKAMRLQQGFIEEIYWYACIRIVPWKLQIRYVLCSQSHTSWHEGQSASKPSRRTVDVLQLKAHLKQQQHRCEQKLENQLNCKCHININCKIWTSCWRNEERRTNDVIACFSTLNMAQIKSRAVLVLHHHRKKYLIYSPNHAQGP